MRPPERWPLDPAPAETESLSSWLRRIAASYGMYSYELVEHGLGHRELRDPELDLNPPTDLLEELAKRTGLGQHRVNAMTMAGSVRAVRACDLDGGLGRIGHPLPRTRGMHPRWGVGAEERRGIAVGSPSTGDARACGGA